MYSAEQHVHGCGHTSPCWLGTSDDLHSNLSWKWRALLRLICLMNWWMWNEWLHACLLSTNTNSFDFTTINPTNLALGWWGVCAVSHTCSDETCEANYWWYYPNQTLHRNSVMSSLQSKWGYYKIYKLHFLWNFINCFVAEDLRGWNTLLLTPFDIA